MAAHCTDPGGRGSCPGGDYARPGWTDATLCDGAPVYQRRGGGAVDGAVLYRRRVSDDGSTYWLVGPSERLADCYGRYAYGDSYYWSGSNPGPSSYAPDAPGYGWSDPGGYKGVHIVAGGGGGGGGH